MVHHMFCSFLPEYEEIVLLYSIAHPVNLMSIALDLVLAVPSTVIFTAVLSVSTEVGGCRWPISARAVYVDVAFCQFSSNLSNYDSVADAMDFLIILHSTCTSLFSGGVAIFGVLLIGFGPSKK